MTSCIVTLVKNEHEYLDEWIQYHLNLGVNYLFIFEDYDSKSHKKICDKYLQVALINIGELLNTDNIIKSRNHIFYQRQIIYLKNALNYIHNNYDYDWCFSIDSDEYITIEAKYNNINEVLKEYNEYDAVLINWKNYGANGLINKPDYSKKGIVETYNKPCEFQLMDKVFWHETVKTVYNMHKFTDDLFKSECTPNLTRNWCKTNYTQDKEHLIYDKMFIRHYITKSWEEYVWKLKTRGMFYSNHRNYDSFFEMNPDMLDKKEKLLSMIN